MLAKCRTRAHQAADAAPQAAHVTTARGDGHTNLGLFVVTGIVNALKQSTLADPNTKPVFRMVSYERRTPLSLASST